VLTGAHQVSQGPPRRTIVKDPPSDSRRAPSPAATAFQPWEAKTAPEPRWWAFVAMLVVVTGQWWVSNSLELQPVWLFPAIAALLLLVSVGIYLPARSNPPPVLRRLALGLVAVVVVANAASLALLVQGVFLGSRLSPMSLLVTGLVLWLVNLTNFALLYWEMDGGGPEERAEGYRAYPDLLFVQQQQPGWGVDDWKPTFADYLYVSLTSATAFSPTDTMPLSKQAKLAMGVESVLSIAILAVLVARAVNVAKG
jgi:uncharacterized membrane protein